MLFCDVVGSTSLGESTDAEALRALLARYFDRMSGIVESHGGSVEKFIGDAVMAVFGVPLVHEDDALRACRAAVEMRDAFPELDLEGRIGVSTGEVVTGTAERLATGDVVNVAARLQQASKPGEVLIGESTRLLAGGAVDVEAVEPLLLKGKREPVSAYRLLAARQAGERQHKTAFVGRERELSLLRDAWRRALTETRCELVTVVGDAGIGKSRLVAEALESVDTPIVSGRCLPYGAQVTYWPVVEVVKQLGVMPSDPSAAAAVRSLLGEADQGTTAEEIAWAFRKLLEEQSPLVVVFDDVQWGEETFVDLIEHVALLSSGAPVLIVCMARPELLDNRPSWAVTVRLEPLSRADSEQLIGAQLPRELAVRIAAAAGGNPLFIGEMLAMSEQGGDGIEVPASLKALLAARLEQLEPRERRVLESAAVEGEVFHRGAVQALTPEEPQVTPRLAGLVRRGLIQTARAQLAGEDGFRFRHLLIRDAAYEVLPKAKRARSHERLAGWLEGHAQNLVELDEIVGYHFDQAFTYRSQLGPLDDTGRALAARAAAHLGAAGRAALERTDSTAARALLQRASELLPREDRERVALLPDLSYALGAVDTHAAIETAAEGVELARLAGDLHNEWQARLALLGHKVDADVDRRTSAEFAAEIDAAIDPLTALGDDRLLAQAWGLLAFVSEGDARDTAARQAMEHARRVGASRVWGGAANTLALDALFGPTTTAKSMALCEEFRQEPDITVHASALFDTHRALLLAFAGRIDEGRDLHVDSRSRFADLGDLLTFHTCAFWRFWIEWCADDLVASEDELLACWEALETAGAAAYNCTTAALLAHVEVDRGRDDDAFRWCERAEEIVSDDDWETVPLIPAARGVVLARRGDLDGGTSLAEEAVALNRAHFEYVTVKSLVLLRLAEVHRIANRPDAERHALEEALAVCEAKGIVPVADRIRARL